ncbi:MAG: 4'-phosphopantetheinyl transferase superfamily protein [Hormoscilla sp. GM102CHS1]|nr:4'-phosphopantetheinyl transferase superfamily protein [Hormoscilla sp. GM102CHS1]
MTPTPWQPAPADLQPSSDVVHVWRANLNLPEQQILQLLPTLSEDEQQRAARFYFQRDRLHFIAARGILRNILGNYLSIAASQVKFSYSPSGKPALDEANSVTSFPRLCLGTCKLEFNLSHSHGLALYAIALDREIGIDLEYIRDLEAEQLAKRFFSHREYTAISSVAPQEQPRVFFHYWTCKEAYLKATGDGLVGLENIDVFLTTKEPHRVPTAQPGNARTDKQQPDPGWSLKQINPGSGYIAAVVVAGGGWHLQTWDFAQTPA